MTKRIIVLFGLLCSMRTQTVVTLDANQNQSWGQDTMAWLQEELENYQANAHDTKGINQALRSSLALGASILTRDQNTRSPKCSIRNFNPNKIPLITQQQIADLNYYINHMNQTTDYGYICMLGTILNTTPETIIFTVYTKNNSMLRSVDTVIANYLVDVLPSQSLSDTQRTIFQALKRIAKQKLSTENT